MRQRAIGIALRLGEQAERERRTRRDEGESVVEELPVVRGQVVVEVIGGVAIADRVGTGGKAPQPAGERCVYGQPVC